MHVNPASITIAPPTRGPSAPVNCTAARRILAAAADVPAASLFPLTRLEDIVGDSLVMELVVLELEEFLGCEADRVAIWKLETVEDLARWMLGAEAAAKD